MRTHRHFARLKIGPFDTKCADSMIAPEDRRKSSGRVFARGDCLVSSMASFSDSASSKERHQTMYKSGVSVEKGADQRRKIAVDIRRSKRAKTLMAKRMKLAATSSSMTAGGGQFAQGGDADLVLPTTTVEVNSLLQDFVGAQTTKSRTHCLKRLRKYLSTQPEQDEEEMADENLSSRSHEIASIPGAIVAFIRCLSDGNAEQQVEASWCLTNIAGGTHEDALKVIDAMPYFVAFLGGDNKPLQEQALWAVGNLAADCQEFRDHLMRSGALVPMIEIFTRSKVPELLSNAAWALSNLARGTQTPATPFCQAGIIRPLIESLHQGVRVLEDGTVDTVAEKRPLIIECCWLASLLTAKEREVVYALVENGILPALYNNMHFRDFRILTPLVRSLGNIFSLPGIPADWLNLFLTNQSFVALWNEVLLSTVSSGTVPGSLLNSNHALVKEAAWCTSSMMACTDAQKSVLSEYGVVNALQVLVAEAIFSVKKEAAAALFNYICDGHQRRVNEVMTPHVLRAIIEMVTQPDVEAARQALNMIHIVLSLPGGPGCVESCGGMDALDHVIYMEGGDAQLKDKATWLSDTFYGGDYGVLEEDLQSAQQMVPSISHDGTTFNFSAGPGTNSTPSSPASIRKGLPSRPAWMLQ
jgi:importin subunit alpha-6/7